MKAGVFMNIPKVKFKKMSLKENIEIIKWAYFEDGVDLNVHNYTIQYFPELEFIDINLSQAEINKKIKEVVTNYYEKYENKIDSEVIRYNQLWEKYNDKYFETLSNFFGCSFPKKINEIVATVGLIPVFPRNLDTLSFSISTNVDDIKLIETTAHEILHFMWFEKWKIIHPETPRRNYDTPYLEWKYSEMVTDPILNNKPFNEIFDFNEKGYDSFYELYDGELLVMDKLRDIYSTDKDINTKIELGFNYIKKCFGNDNKD